MSRFLVSLHFSVFLLAASLGCAQSLEFPACSSMPPHFCADMCYFRDEQGYSIEIYLGIRNSDIQFVKTPAGFEAGADASVVLLSGKKQISGDTRSIRLYAARYDETTSVDTCKVIVIPLKAQSGNLRAIINLKDRESRAKSTVDVSFTLESMDNNSGLSDIVLLQSNQDFSGPRWSGYEPVVKRSLDMSRPGYGFYYEVYLGEEADTFSVKHTLKAVNGEVKKNWEAVIHSCSVCRRQESLECDSLTNGTYLIDVTLLAKDGKQVAKRSKQFEISSVSFYFDRDIDGAVALVAYIATGQWISEFKKADPDRRKKIWEDFWREKDPNPVTPKNEFYEEHVRRFKYANENFASSLTPGWQTDRGRIYILNGEPDEIDRYSGDVSRNPMEVWYYYTKGRRFIFVDETGFGDYVLVSDR